MLDPWKILIATLVVFVLVVYGLVFVWWLLRLWRRLEVPTRVPLRHLTVVLAHGLFGFDEMRLQGRRLEYFRGVASHLQDLGAEVHCPKVPRVAVIAARAKHLITYIQQLPSRRVIIIGHSMGGLDARYALAQLTLTEKITSLITIGTPHWGTPLASLASTLAKAPGLKRLLHLIGFDTEGIVCLSTKKMKQFNALVCDVPKIVYGSVVGTVIKGSSHIHPLLLPCFRFFESLDEPSDGLVPSRSQEWGEVFNRIEADHFAQVGWSKHFDAVGFYEELLRELRGRGC